MFVNKFVLITAIAVVTLAFGLKRTPIKTTNSLGARKKIIEKELYLPAPVTTGRQRTEANNNGHTKSSYRELL
jgi:hypothetical protein